MEQNFGELLNGAVDSVLNQMLTRMPIDEYVVGTLVLCTTYVVSPKTVRETLRAKFGDAPEFALFEDAEFNSFGYSSITVQTREDERKLMGKAANSANIVLATPKLNLMQRIADGDDDGFVEHLVMRSLLWGRNVYILLDFEKPKFKRGTFYEKIGDIIDSLTNMGVKLLTYSPVGEQETDVFSLVTQVEVEDASRRGIFTVYCSKDAIITPLARERAVELGISIEGRVM